jgi:hypothetical protein
MVLIRLDGSGGLLRDLVQPDLFSDPPKHQLSSHCQSGSQQRDKFGHRDDQHFDPELDFQGHDVPGQQLGPCKPH